MASSSAAVIKALILEKRTRWQSAKEPAPPAAPPPPVDPHTLTSAQWLSSRSLAAQRLTFYDAVRPYVFRHAMGPEDILRADADAPSLSSRVVPRATHTRCSGARQMLVRSPQCLCRGAAVPGDDASEMGRRHRRACQHHGACPRLPPRRAFGDSQLQAEYDRKLAALTAELQARISWLRTGTKALFGELCCEHVCIVVDVSDSMRSKMTEIREKLHALLRDQARTVCGRHRLTVAGTGSGQQVPRLAHEARVNTRDALLAQVSAAVWVCG